MGKETILHKTLDRLTAAPFVGLFFITVAIEGFALAIVVKEFQRGGYGWCLMFGGFALIVPVGMCLAGFIACQVLRHGWRKTWERT